MHWAALLSSSPPAPATSPTSRWTTARRHWACVFHACHFLDTRTCRKHSPRAGFAPLPHHACRARANTYALRAFMPRAGGTLRSFFMPVPRYTRGYYQHTTTTFCSPVPHGVRPSCCIAARACALHCHHYLPRVIPTRLHCAFPVLFNGALNALFSGYLRPCCASLSNHSRLLCRSSRHIYRTGTIHNTGCLSSSSCHFRCFISPVAKPHLAAVYFNY